MTPLIADIKANTRDYMLTLIPNIYTSIELSQAQNYFGVAEEGELLQGKLLLINVYCVCYTDVYF